MKTPRLLAGAAALPLTLLALTACSGPLAAHGTMPVTGTAGPAGMSSPVTATTPATTSAAPAPSQVPVIASTAVAPGQPITNPRQGQGLDFGYLTKVTQSSGAVTITFDRAEFVWNTKVEDDYNITDNSKKLRVFTVEPNAALRMLAPAGDGLDPAPVGLKEFVAKADQEIHGTSQLPGQRVPVWVRHTNGLSGPVTALTEQYLP